MPREPISPATDSTQQSVGISDLLAPGFRSPDESENGHLLQGGTSSLSESESGPFPFERIVHTLESCPVTLRSALERKGKSERIDLLGGIRLWQMAGRPNQTQWQEMCASRSLRKYVPEILGTDQGNHLLKDFGVADLA